MFLLALFVIAPSWNSANAHYWMKWTNLAYSKESIQHGVKETRQKREYTIISQIEC